MSRSVVTATWDDAPHLGQAEKEDLWNAIPVYQRDARSKGIPQLGSGAIYPVQEENLTVSDFVIPEHWKRAYGMDVGWNMTACVWAAIDTEADVVYLVSEYYQGQAEPETHAKGIKSRGDWIPGVIDPASRGRSQKDGTQLINEYRGIGLKLTEADNSVEAGLFKVYERMVSGRLKVFKSLSKWFEEFRIYRRDENGKVVKVADHLMDCTRYLVMSGISIARFRPIEMTSYGKPKPYDPLNWHPGQRR